MKTHKDNDFEHIVLCKHGKLSHVINLETQEHKHIGFWEFIKSFINQ